MNIQFNQSINQIPKALSQNNILINNVERNARNAFIKKVYTIVALQLAVTCFLTAIAVSFPQFRDFQNRKYALFYINGFIMMIIQILIFCTQAGRKHPLNLILLGIFTLCQSYVVSYICSLYYQQLGGQIILQAVGLTAIMVAGLTAFACLTKRDLTIYLGLMFILGIALFLFLIAIIFFENQMIMNLYMILGVLFFGLYLVIDTQLLLDGKRYRLTLDDYVLGALFLYIDIIALFIRILIILGRFQNRR